MPRVSIQQFRAALANRSEQSAVVRAYRPLARRPELAAGMPRTHWIPCADAPGPAWPPFGRTGLTVPAFGMGTWRTFDVHGGQDEARSREIIRVAFEHGANLFDTSPMYGEAERVLGSQVRVAGFEGEVPRMQSEVEEFLERRGARGAGQAQCDGETFIAGRRTQQQSQRPRAGRDRRG
jgi:hypothetical protein